MTKIVFLDKSTFPSSLKFNKPSFPHQWQEYQSTNPEDVISRLEGAEIAVLNKVVLNSEILKKLPDLKMIAISATGYNNIDIDTALEQNITVCNVRGYAVNTVPEHAMMLILALSRSLKIYQNEVEQGRWQQSEQFCFLDHPIEDLHDKTLGIVGRGILGQGLARLASGFGMGIMYAGRKGEEEPHKPYIPFDEFLEQSDIISLHCPLTEHTNNLFTKTEFAKMTRKPILINTARGGIVNEQDAVDALEKGQIRALGFDCLTKEPPTPDNPILKIANHPNVLLTPHIAWASSEAVQGCWDQLITNIEKWKKGTPQNTINL